MVEIQVTKMSSKGQVVILDAIRTRLGLKPGVQFVVIGEGDTVVLKPIAEPSMREFDEVMGQAREAARRAGMKRSDVASAIASVRSR